MPVYRVGLTYSWADPFFIKEQMLTVGALRGTWLPAFVFCLVCVQVSENRTDDFPGGFVLPAQRAHHPLHFFFPLYFCITISHFLGMTPDMKPLVSLNFLRLRCDF